ncbi:MAG TPA: hypothetical protein VIL31_01135 [Cyclobacteriaceae bacterium]|jgi:hypothetical protein
MTIQFGEGEYPIQTGTHQVAVKTIVLPYETVEEVIYLRPEYLYKYYRLVVAVSGDYYVFDFVRETDATGGAGVALLMLHVVYSWALLDKMD